MIRTIRENIKLNYFLVALVLISTVCPFFMQTKVHLIVSFVILLVIFILRGGRIDIKIILLILIAVSLILIQGIAWGIRFLTIVTYVSSVILTPYFLFRIVGEKLFEYIVKIIYVTAIYTTILWLLQNLIPPFDNYMQNLKEIVFQMHSFDVIPRSLIFYTVAIVKAELSLFDIYRNSGIYHEPGAFAYWLIIGIGLNTIITKSFFGKKNRIMMVALLTTFSTAGYLSLFALSLFFIAKSRINILLRALIFIVFVFSVFHIYTNAGFLQEKMSRQYENEGTVALEGEPTSGRIISARKALNIIEQNPIFGRGIITASAENDPYSAFHGESYSATAIVVNYGLFFGFIFYWFFLKGIKLICNKYQFSRNFALFFFVAILIGAFSQSFLYDNITVQFFLFGLLFSNLPPVRHPT